MGKGGGKGSTGLGLVQNFANFFSASLRAQNWLQLNTARIKLKTKVKTKLKNEQHNNQEHLDENLVEHTAHT